MNWFEKMKSGILTRIKREIPEGVWSQCKQCGEAVYQNALERDLWVCSHCGFHFPIGHEKYIDILADSGSFTELDAGVATADPLKFRDHRRYPDRIREARRASGLNESVCTGVCRIGGHPVALGIMDTRYILEKMARLIDRAIADGRSLVLLSQSGGARMQESTYSLMQMAKLSAKLRRLSDAGLLYISILTDPTYGGVTASFAMLGDIHIAEPGARIGFAGQSVIKQFLGLEELPAGFQIAENVQDHGFVDLVAKRSELTATVTRIIALLAPASAETGAAPVAPSS
jgi:acetyl-CoA carboxylase carboxyl transferase subunit beta